LRNADIELDLATDDAFAADRQQALQVVALDVEIDERDEPGPVVAGDAVRPAAHAGVMALDLELQCDDAVVLELADRRRRAAVDKPGRQVPQQVDDQPSGGALDEPAELWSDARQRRHRRKKPVEKGRAHAIGYPLFAVAHDATSLSHYILRRAPPSQ